MCCGMVLPIVLLRVTGGAHGFYFQSFRWVCFKKKGKIIFASGSPILFHLQDSSGVINNHGLSV
jgi:hypothetical protein